MTKDIVVGIDESPSAWAALTWAASHARATGARLRAIHVLEAREARELYEIAVLGTHVYPDTDDLDPAWTERGRRVFAEIAPEPSWTLQFGQGHPGRIMVDESRDAEMLVVGTGEHRGLGRLVNGSVSHFCVNHAFCPVVAVPATADAAAPGRTVGAAVEYQREPVPQMIRRLHAVEENHEHA